MIKSIKIANFKSILSLGELSFSDGTTFIIGKNGAGKSTLLSALCLTKKIASKATIDEALSDVAPFGFELFTKNSRKMTTEIQLRVKDDLGQVYKYSYSIGVTSSSFAITEESLTKMKGEEEAPVFHRTNNELKALDQKTQKLVDVPLSITSVQAVLSNYNDETVAKVAALIAGYKILWFDKSTDPSGFKVHIQDKLDQISLDAIVVDLFKNKKNAFDNAVKIIKQLIPEFEAPIVQTISPGTAKKDEKGKMLDRYVVFWKESGDLEYTITGLSDGNFRIIQLIFTLLASQKSVCLVGEEIENGQHYGRIKTLLEVLRVLSIKLDIQLIFTTHSKDLLSYVNSSDVVYCYKDEQGHSQFEYLDEKVDTDSVRNALGKMPTTKDYLDLGLA